MARESRTKVWTDLTQMAILGVTATKSSTLPASQGELGKLLREIERNERYINSPQLRFLAQLAAVNLAARTAPKVSQAPRSIWTPCPDESQPVAPAAAQSILNLLLTEPNKTNNALLIQWLKNCAASGQRIEEMSLPRLLELPTKTPELRSLLAECGGEHLTWLLSINEKWRAEMGIKMLAEEDLTTVFAEGKIEERIESFRLLRQMDPEQARHLLQASWSQESLDAKKAFAQALADRLSSADEELLTNTVFKEKRKELKYIAVSLLVRLPGSEVAGLLKDEAKRHIAMEGGKLSVTLPAEGSHLEELLDREGIKFTSRATVLSELIAHVPPSIFVTHLRKPANEIVRLFSRDEDWGLALLSGLFDATVLFKDRAFEIALLAEAEDKLTESNQGMNFIRSLSRENLEALVLRRLPLWQGSGGVAAPKLDLWYYLEQVDFDWSEHFTREIFSFIAKEIKEKVPALAHTFQSNAERFALNMHISATQRVDELKADDAASPWLKKAIDKLAEVLTLRKEIHQAFKQQKRG